jgi:hypothetical protein
MQEICQKSLIIKKQCKSNSILIATFEFIIVNLSRETPIILNLSSIFQAVLQRRVQYLTYIVFI